MPGIALPPSVESELPLLRSHHCVFFDFGMARWNSRRFPVVVVLSRSHVVIASFPPSKSGKDVQHLIPLERVTSMTRDGLTVTLQTMGRETENEIHFELSKADAFVVFFVDLQHRAVGKGLHLVAAPTETVTNVRGRVDAAALSTVANIGDAVPLSNSLNVESNNINGVVRFGFGSSGLHAPCTEWEEDSDASSIATLCHDIVSSDDEGDPHRPDDSPTLRQKVDGKSIRLMMEQERKLKRMWTAQLARGRDELHLLAAKEAELRFKLEALRREKCCASSSNDSGEQTKKKATVADTEKEPLWTLCRVKEAATTAHDPVAVQFVIPTHVASLLQQAASSSVEDAAQGLSEGPLVIDGFGIGAPKVLVSRDRMQAIARDLLPPTVAVISM